MANRIAAALLTTLGLVAATAAQADDMRIAQTQVPDYRSIAATITTRDTGEVRARISGTLTSLKVREGDIVKAGQVLAIVSDQKVAIEEQSRISQAVAMKAESDRAAADLARVRQLFDKGFYSQAKLDQAVAASKAATAAWKAAASATALTSEIAQQGKLLAPADGRVLQASVPAGAVVMAGDVVVVMATNDAVIRLELPEREARGLKKGDAIRISDDTGNGTVEQDVRIREIYPQVRDGKITIDLDMGALKSSFVGERVRAKVAVGVRSSIVVPKSYVSTRFGVDYVRLVTSSGALDIPVQIGQGITTPGGEAGVEVLSGLRPGDTISKPGRAPVQS
jgi:RND family efflux transporter MFP subunit